MDILFAGAPGAVTESKYVVSVAGWSVTVPAYRERAKVVFPRGAKTS